MHFLLRVDGIVHTDGDAALQLASWEGQLAVVEVLLAHGADVNAGGGWPLRNASENGHPAVVEVLLARGADVHADGDCCRWRAGEATSPSSRSCSHAAPTSTPTMTGR